MKTMITNREKCIRNAKRDLGKFEKAARETVGAERAKYLQGCRNLRGYLAALARQSKLLPNIIILALTVTCGAETIERSCTVSNRQWLVKYEFNPDGYCTIPLTNPLGQPHYPCRVFVFRKSTAGDFSALISEGKPFDGVVTRKGCFEDNPEDMVRRVMGWLSLTELWNRQAERSFTNNWPMEGTNANYWGWVTNTVITNYYAEDVIATNWLRQTWTSKLDLYWRCQPRPRTEDHWWEGPGGRVTDTNLAAMLDAWWKERE